MPGNNNATRTALDHPDKRGVWLPRWVLDLVPDDLGAAMLLAQLLWWHQPAYGTNLPRARYQRGGHWWLLRADDEWGEECGLSVKQVRRIRRVLLAEGLVITARFKNAQGAPTTAWRPDFEAIHASKLQIPEVPSEGQFHGSDPQGAVPCDPPGVVPTPLTRGELEPEPLPTRARSIGKHRLPDDFAPGADDLAKAADQFPLVDLDRETEAFRDWAVGGGKTYADWPATWRNWMRRRQSESEANPPRSNGVARYQPSGRSLTPKLDAKLAAIYSDDPRRDT